MIKEMIRIFPDVHVHSDPYSIQFGSGDWITAITRTTGTFTGEMILPGGKVTALAGKAFDLVVTTTPKWDPDSLVVEFLFWDSALQPRQIASYPLLSAANKPHGFA
jgi:hypothetical protein